MEAPVLLEELDESLESLLQSCSGWKDLAGDTPQAVRKSEFYNQILTLQQHVAHVSQQLQVQQALEIPDLGILNIDKQLGDFDLQNKVESTVLKWNVLLTKTLEQEKQKQPTETSGLISEINYWRARLASLASISEQLNTEKAKKIIQFYEKAEGQYFGDFSNLQSTLEKEYTEAKEISKFLGTLERHFFLIEKGSFSMIDSNLPALMNILRLLWLISTHFSSMEKMGGLFVKISHQLCNRAKDHLDMKTLFSLPARDAAAAIGESRDLLTRFKQSYFNARQQIEDAGDQRWEFHHRFNYFEQVDYIVRVCDDLLSVVNKVHMFDQILGNELKVISGDAVGVEKVRVSLNDLTRPMQTLPFDHFSTGNKTKWLKVMQTFNEEAEETERETALLIESSFRNLRSVDGAFDFIRRFSGEECTAAIQQVFDEQLTRILDKCDEQVKATRAIFEAKKNNPPRPHSVPPAAGAIAWANFLLASVKKPVVRFKIIEFGELWKGKDSYVQLCRALKQYGRERFEAWQKQITTNIMAYLNVHVFAVDNTVYPPALSVNFDPQLTMAIKEAKYMDRIGEKIPSIALDVALQEDKFRTRLESLNMVVGNYSRAVDSIRPIEKDLLTQRIRQLLVVLQPGLVTFNWNSLGLDEFIQEAMTEIDQFQSVITHAHDNEDAIHTVIDRIARAKLFTLPDYPASSVDLNVPVGGGSAASGGIGGGEKGGRQRGRNDKEREKRRRRGEDLVTSALGISQLRGVTDLPSFVRQLETSRERTATELYHTFSQTAKLKNNEIEANIFNQVASGRHPRMSNFYLYWELNLLNALKCMVQKNIALFARMLGESQQTPSGPRKRLLFQIEPQLVAGTIVESPTRQEITRQLRTFVTAICETPQKFPRWVRGTCDECPRQPQWSFYVETKGSQEQLVTIPMRIVERTMTKLAKCLAPWKRDEKLLAASSADRAKQIQQYEAQCQQALSTITQTSSAQSSASVSVGDSGEDGKGEGGERPASAGADGEGENESGGSGSGAGEKAGKKKTTELFQVPIRFYAQQMGVYARLIDTVRERPDEAVIDFVGVNFTRLKEALVARAKEIILEIGKALHASPHTKPKVAAMNEVIANYTNAIHKEPQSLDELKQLLSVMEEIRSVAMEKELEYTAITERYALLHQHGLDRPFIMRDKETGKETEVEEEVSEEEMNDAMSLPQKWQALMEEVETVKKQLNTIKKNFSKETQKDVEKFRGDLEEFAKGFEQAALQFTREGADLDAAAEEVANFQQKLMNFKAEREQLLEAERMFDLPMSQYPVMKEMELRLAGLNRIYDLHKEVKQSIDQWSGIRWEDLHIDELTQSIDAYKLRMKRIGKDKELARLAPYQQVQQTIDNFGTSLQLIACFKNPSLQPRHWEELMERTKQRFDLSSMTLRNLLGMQLYNYEKEIQDIAAMADREMGIEKELDGIAELWRATRFEVVKHSLQGMPSSDRGYVIKGVDQIEEKLEDHVQSLQAMQASRYYRPHREKGAVWEKNLGCISAVTTQWIAVQKKWLYLENIFIGSEDIRTRMPEQAKDFDAMDRDFRKIMTDTYRQPNVLEACSVPGRESQLISLMAMLEHCQKSLSEYLEGKRVIFPRFFFISEDDLLSILGSSDPQAVQRHLPNLFDNCQKLIFGTGVHAKTISGMISEEGEVLQFRADTQAEGSVEQWMTEVEAEMRRSLKVKVKEAIYYYTSMPRVKWIEKFLGLATVVGSQVWWTWGVEDAFQAVRAGNKHALKNYNGVLGQQIRDLVATMRGGSSVDAMMRAKVKNMIILDVHARDIVSDFIRDSVLDAREFDWERQLRFYFDKNKEGVVIRQCTGEFDYGYEYIGLRDRLIITPLTDRCYITLTQALSMRYGGAPAGPAGTGKTETVKDLAKGLALFCVVFNCQQGLNATFMGSLFTGLCEIGAWGCFDEFNRIDPDVMSVISNQISRIQNALRAQAPQFKLDGTHEVGLDPKVGIFITMNPGYAGRSELPDNLKALFRPCVMVVPDKEQICEILLFSEGFDTAKNLAKKMTVLYKRAEGQLSQQKHYDFGLRALKAVLAMAGSLKRASPDTAEDVVLMRALRDMNLPKFVYQDVPLFMGLIHDLYPDLELPKQSYPEFNEAVEEVMRSHDYVVTEQQVLKVIQLYDTMFTRHTTMVVGPSGGGKTVVIQLLQEAQTRLGYPTKLYVLNPKSISINELYGVSDPNTNDWEDGLLSNIFRYINTTPMEKRERRYIVYDGDVDAHWVENMNSVMDDNRLLTLPNRERIYLRRECAMLFEVGNLAHASPATVSRCGMVYVDPHDLPPRVYFLRWLASRPKEEQDALRTWHDRYVPKCFEYIFEGLIDGIPVTEDEKKGDSSSAAANAAALDSGEPTEVDPIEAAMGNQKTGIGEDGRLLQAVPQSAISLTAQLCGLYQALVPPEGLDVVKYDEPVRHMLFIFALAWAMGGSLLEGSRQKFDEFLKRTVDLSVISAPEHDAGVNQLPGQLPTLFDFYFDVEKRAWKAWETRVTPYEPPPDRLFCNILVPTVDTVRHIAILSLLVEQKVPVLFIGESGTAKTVTIQNYLRSLNPESTASLNINFSNRTNSLILQRTLDDNLDRPLMGVIRPRAGKKMIVFADDINMPQMDNEETQQPIALLKFLFDRGGLYGRSSADLSFRKYADIQFVCAMGPPGGGRHPTDVRFTSKFSIFNLPFPTVSSLKRIYESILNHHFEPFSQEIRQAVPVLVENTLILYFTVTNQLPATPKKFHYIFNLRDLSRVTEGLTLSTPGKFPSLQTVLRLWCHEILRVFQDRLIDYNDRELVRTKMRELVTQSWPELAENAYSEPLLFGSYKKANLSVGDPIPGELDEKEKEAEAAGGASASSSASDAGDDPKEYEDLENFDAIKPVVEECLETYNETRLRMNLVMFADALQHLARIHRIIRMCRGNALLIGYGGFGKQSLTKLATFIAGYSLFQITLSRGYGDEAFRQDLKKLYQMLGVQNKEVVFLFTDAHVVNSSFLEYINSMLTSGMVPALYAEDEKDAIIRELSEEMTRFGLFSRDECWNHFVNKCRNNLHIVLCMSPAGDTLRIRCRNFPGLVSNTCIDWFESWSDDALIPVANVFLADEDLPDEHHENIILHMVSVHKSMSKFNQDFFNKMRRHNYVTPKNYLDYINNYKKLLRENRKKFDEQAEHLQQGVERLKAAAVEVDEMNEKLREQKKVVDEQARACDELVQQIELRTAEVKKKSEDVEKRKKELWEEQENIVVDKQEAERELAEAEPALRAAAQALKFLEDNKDSINEMRAYNIPPKAVEQVCECVGILLGESDLSWESTRLMLRKPDFLDRLLNYPKEQLLKKESIMARVKPRMKGQDPGKVKASISKAAGSIMEWVFAIDAWYDKAKVVQPKKDRVEAAEARLRQSQLDLEKAEQEIEALTKELTLLDQALQQKRQEQAELRTKLATMERQLNAAKRLIAALGTENVRWNRQARELAERKKLLIGDCLLTAAFLSYCGAFSHDFRDEMVYGLWEKDIRDNKIPLSNPFHVETLLTDDVEISKWRSESLPGDELSIQNGILTTRSSRFPLCIDPQEQAVKWIRKREAGNELIRTSFTSDFLPQLRRAIMFGRPILFENVEENIDTILDPVLEKNILRTGGSADGTGGRRYIILGDQEVDWSPDFRLYMTTKMSNPHYTPEIAGKTMIVNFNVTPQGLEEQLLNAVVGIEREDLEKGHEELIQTMSELRESLKETEDTLLREFTAVKGSLLDNEELICLLEKTKTIHQEVTDKLERAKENEKQIEEARSRYRPAATRGSTLFFVMSSLSSVSSMCEYSLDAFRDIFIQSIKQAQRSDDLFKRLKNIIEVVTDNVFNYVCLGLFERFRLMFAFQMTLKIMEQQNMTRDSQLHFFLKGSLSLEKAAEPRPAGTEDFLTEDGWKDAIELVKADPERFGNFIDLLRADPDSWREWAQNERPEEVMPPMRPFNAKSSSADEEEKGEGEEKGEEDGENRKEEKAPANEKDNKRKARKDEAEEDDEAGASSASASSSSSASNAKAGSGAEGEVSDPGRICGSIDPNALSELERLCLLRIFRVDRITAGVNHFVVAMMGAKYVNYPILLYDDIYNRSTAFSPVVFIISPGSDPATDVIALGERKGFMQPLRLRNISLGQNMEPLAEQAIDQAVTRGQWVLLQNCHLLPKWLKILEKKLEQIAERDADSVDPEFRLFLTSEPTDQFPMGILQRSLKVVTEPPNSLRMNMLTTYGKIGREELERSNHPAYRPLIYVLAFFHAVVQERGKYGKLGWNVLYDFNESDFRVSLDLIATYLNKACDAALEAAGAGGSSTQSGAANVALAEAEEGNAEANDDDEEKQIIAGVAEINPDFSGEDDDEDEEEDEMERGEGGKSSSTKEKEQTDDSGEETAEESSSASASASASSSFTSSSSSEAESESSTGAAPPPEVNFTTAPVPWASLRYLVGEVMYGGRVTDDWDRRILMTYQDEYMGDFLFDTFQPFHFFKDSRVDYTLPPEPAVQSIDPQAFVNYIEANIPAASPPEVFGLHQNAEIAFNTQAARHLWMNVINLQGRGKSASSSASSGGSSASASSSASSSGSADGSSEDERLLSIADDVQSRIPAKNVDLTIIRKGFGVPQPTQVVLLQELEHWNRLCDKMRISLKEMRRALAGEIGMSAELDNLVSSLSSGFLPDMWRNLAPATQKNLAGWMDHFLSRRQQYESWVADGEPRVIWLSGFHLPEAYIHAVVQEACRKNKWPLDRSAIYTRVTEFTSINEVLTKPSNGCFVRGLFLEGASWDYENRQLLPQQPKQLLCELPILHIVPIEASQKRLQNTFTAPVYVTQDRCNKMGVGFVFEANLDSTMHQSHWVLQGVALLLNDS
ncbi:dynein haevy chain 5, inner dynein arm 1 alpha [Monocercomonoides exilis]|uniref:dynein haevy chain 5, inner dynein arm 1 alpha n=1 Tax=Monocercomonoides exilis TaxID=2049356 RepID=UPI00355A53AA|nr:dynein haevy chain 5, inner dynein arm 1 alpha [Monocercomonoides exilis]|eukprot:MONOS_10134.1-p1 / transcript=MONOS_10134.1 / gene=MONOS_10134 / organism=Monocercomonoides_exilis_PA203 / gene_product=dynein haevy chain 5, inner dynein arm 1 alpha / transcript_product=dynein haevy chain 5, inner dynein arm 1 alpha / location=Mono_scaffold00447:24868-39602(-) / protein_length=4861 / sequence_SO=supercontig / SO=protein_coding / is_pseudo=false